MNPVELAQWGMGFFAVACLVTVVLLVIKQYGQKSQPTPTKCADRLSKVIENNTKAVNELTTVIQVNLAKQDGKIDEILARVRDN